MGGRQNTMYVKYDRSAIRGSALAGLVFATRRHHTYMRVSGASMALGIPLITRLMVTVSKDDMV